MADITQTRSDEARALPPAEMGSEAVAAPVGRSALANGQPTDPDEMREEILRTRARMSTTLDVLEHRLVEQKRQIWAKATLQGFRRRITSEPWRSMAIAFAAGYIVAAIRD